MFKRYFIVFLSVAFMLSLYFTVNKPLFSDYADRYELYLKENSSIAGIVNADKYSFPFYVSVKGEACVVKCGDEKEIIGDFNAEIIFTEETDDAVIIYAYSKKIPYEKIVSGKKVNLQIAKRNDVIKVGSPLIYGSF